MSAQGARTTRRAFLIAGLRFGAGGAVAFQFGCADRGVPTLDLSQILGDVDGVLAVGAGYLAGFPDEAEASALESAIGVVAADAGGVRGALRDRIRADFADGRLFRHEGWWLSRTEGRLCALAVLQRG